MKYTQEQIDDISVAATKLVASEFAEFNTPNPPEVTPGMVRNVLKAIAESRLHKAHSRLYEAARNVLELSEPSGDDEFIMHQDNYNDLAQAHAAVFRAGNLKANTVRKRTMPCRG